VALLRHKRDANARITRSTTPTAVKVAAPVAALVTLSAVGVGVLASSPQSDVLASQAAGAISQVPEREIVVSRADARDMYRQAGREMARLEAAKERRATQRAIRNADTRLWTTEPLNLWTLPGDQAEKVGLVDERKRVLVTGRKAYGRTEVVIDQKSRWVTSGYLVEDKPRPPKPEPEESTDTSAASESSEPSTPSLGGACTNGTSVSGQPNVIGVHQAVCASFPEITSYGTYRSDGEHAQGLAIDIMVSGDRGWQVAEFLRANRSELGISYIMYSQKIWSVERSGEGWRYVEDRGSATANHYDHVHVTTY
jgi:hypothetical protein